jgi:hypothetical protein
VDQTHCFARFLCRHVVSVTLADRRASSWPRAFDSLAPQAFHSDLLSVSIWRDTEAVIGALHGVDGHDQAASPRLRAAGRVSRTSVTGSAAPPAGDVIGDVVPAHVRDRDLLLRSAPVIVSTSAPSAPLCRRVEIFRRPPAAASFFEPFLLLHYPTFE